MTATVTDLKVWREKRRVERFAREFGYPLCRCSSPPEIMLWREELGRSVCPRCSESSTQTEQTR